MARVALGAAGSGACHARGNLNNHIGAADDAVRPRRTGTRRGGRDGDERAGRDRERSPASREPDVGVLTCVAAAHTEGLGTVDGVARGKGRAARGALPRAGSWSPTRDDDARWRPAARGARARDAGSLRTRRGVRRYRATHRARRPRPRELAASSVVHASAQALSSRLRCSARRRRDRRVAAAIACRARWRSGSSREATPLGGARAARARGDVGRACSDRAARARWSSTTATTPTPALDARLDRALRRDRARRAAARSCSCSARCASSGRSPRAQHDAVGARAAERAAPALDRARRRATAARIAVRERRRRTAVVRLADAGAARDRDPPTRAARRRGAGQGLARRATPSASCNALASCRRRPEGGAVDDLRAPLPAAPHYGWLGWLNVLRYVPFRAHRGDDDRDASTLRPRAVVHPRAAEEADRAGRPRDGPETHTVKARHADDGRRAASCSRCSCSTVLWRDSRNVFVLARRAVTAGYGVIGYLDDYLKIKTQELRGLSGALQAARPVPRRRRGARPTCSRRDASMPAGLVADPRSRLAIPFVAFAKHPIELPRLALRRVRASSSWSARPTRSTSPTASTASRSAR